MRASLLTVFLVSGLAFGVQAQTPPASGPVSASCKDGSTQSGNTAIGACRGHGGVQRAGAAANTAVPPAADTPAGAAPVTPGAPATPARRTNGPLAQEAPGGGPGMVWVNSSTKVYHCQGDRYYGRTRHGSYMTEAAAKTAGAHGSGNKACTPAQ